MEVQGDAAGERSQMAIVNPPVRDGSTSEWQLEVKVEGRHTGIARRWVD
jgi:hypothetical protein